MKFFLNVLATIVGLIVFTTISFLLFFSFIAIVTSEKETKVSKKTVIHLDLNRVIQDLTADDPFSELSFAASGTAGPIGLIDLQKALKKASNDPNIEGILLKSGMPMTGFASLEEIRRSLADFKTSGKFVVAYDEMYTEPGYFVASVSDKVYMYPEGIFMMMGLGIEMTFIKNTLEKLGVEPQVFRVGEFKSAVEPYLNEKMSQESRMQTESFVNSIYDQVLNKVSESRGIPVADLRKISNTMETYHAERAVEVGILDGLKYHDQVMDELREKLDIEGDKKISFIGIKSYMKVKGDEKYSPNKVAILVANGTIMPGKSGSNQIGSEKFAEEVRKLRLDKSIKAVVLRINSPGGSALASDVIWRELELLKQEKPLIASMSDVAASGGYQLAMGANAIVAEHSTITGSIGVFAVWFNAQQLLNKHLGITTDYVGTGEFSNMFTLSKPLSAAEKNILQTSVERTYEKFTTKAAEGRNMQVEDILKVASGRVWSGSQALEIGLVDQLGGINDAVSLAASKAELEDYRVLVYPAQVSFIEEILSSMNEGMEMRILKARYGSLTKQLETIKQIENLKGPQARLPFEISFY